MSRRAGRERRPRRLFFKFRRRCHTELEGRKDLEDYFSNFVADDIYTSWKGEKTSKIIFQIFLEGGKDLDDEGGRPGRLFFPGASRREEKIRNKTRKRSGIRTHERKDPD
jgi:hypothetical protein